MDCFCLLDGWLIGLCFEALSLHSPSGSEIHCVYWVVHQLTEISVCLLSKSGIKGTIGFVFLKIESCVLWAFLILPVARLSLNSHLSVLITGFLDDMTIPSSCNLNLRIRYMLILAE